MIKAELGLNKSGFTAGLNAAKVEAQKFGLDFAGMIKKDLVGSFFSAEALMGAVKGFGRTVIEGFKQAITEAKEIEIGAINLQIDQREFQILRNAAKESGLEVGDLVGATKRLAVALTSLKSGGDEAKKVAAALKILGVSLDEASTGDRKAVLALLTKQMGALAAAGKITDEQIAALADLGFKNPQQFFAFFARGVQEIDKLGVATEETTKKLLKLEEAGTAGAGIKKTIFRTLAEDALDSMGPLSDAMKKLDAEQMNQVVSTAVQTAGRTTVSSLRSLYDVAYAWKIVGMAYENIRNTFGKPIPTPEAPAPPALPPREMPREMRDKRAKYQEEVDALQTQIRMEEARNAPVEKRLKLLRDELDLINQQIKALDITRPDYAKEFLELELRRTKLKGDIQDLQKGGRMDLRPDTRAASGQFIGQARMLGRLMEPYNPDQRQIAELQGIRRAAEAQFNLTVQQVTALNQVAAMLGASMGGGY